MPTALSFYAARLSYSRILENLHGAAIAQMLAINEIEGKFSEFKASELYNGTGPFAEIEEKQRFQAIRVLLTAIKMEKLPYIYCAVDRKKLRHSPMGSAKPFDVAFRFCALGVEDWAQSMHPRPSEGISLDFKDFYLLIMDDTEDENLKDQLRTTYHSLRRRHVYLGGENIVNNRLWHAHDDMYFGDSRHSIGIQMVDLCNYFMWRNLVSKDGGEEFYEMFSGRAICAKPEPEWSVYRNLLRCHTEGNTSPVATTPNSERSG